MQNRISKEIPAADIEKFQQKMQEIRELFPWLISLTAEERLGGLRLGDRTYPFMMKAMEYVDSHPYFLPSYIDVAEMKKDFKLWVDLNSLLRANDILRDAIADTAAQAGAEAMEGVFAYYASVREAAKRNAPDAQTIYNELKVHFAGRGSKKNVEEP